MGLKTCVPARENRSVFFGAYPISSSDGVIEIERVYLTGSQNLELANSYVVPLVGQSGGGNSRNPEKENFWEWDQRVGAAGATISPGSGPHALVLEVRKTGTTGSASDVRVDYRMGGRDYYSVWTDSITLADGKCPEA